MPTFESETFIEKASLSEVFDFFCDEKNLERITPPWLQFRVLSRSTPKIQEGTKLVYRLRIHGVPVTWETLIESWEPEKQFVDRQIRGPYQLWRHLHTFEEKEGGVLARDQVEYQLPFGSLGQLLAGSFVAKDVQKIFDYRQQQIHKLFAKK